MLPISDLEEILTHSNEVMKFLYKKKIFLTGGTGFIGKWLIESFLYANKCLSLDACMYVLSRNPRKFLELFPQFANRPDLYWIEGDVESFSFPQGEFHVIIHGATSVADPSPSLKTFDTIVLGTKRVLDFSVKCRAKNLLLLSSGAVYGKQPPNIEQIPESFHGGPDSTKTNSAYGLGKLAAEWLSFEYGVRYGFNVCSARCYALVGPYLPLDKHFAMGNFILDVINDRPIKINSDGTPFRSYLYGADLSAWLWTILLKGRGGEAYNVGSDIGITIRELAELIASISFDQKKILISKPLTSNELPERYVPNINKAKTDLGLDVWTPIDQGIKKTIDWIKRKND